MPPPPLPEGSASSQPQELSKGEGNDARRKKQQLSLTGGWGECLKNRGQGCQAGEEGWCWGRPLSEVEGLGAGVQPQVAGVLRSRADGQPRKQGRDKLGSKAQRAV